MINKPKNASLYQTDILNALRATGIRQSAPGGKARAIGDAVGDGMGELAASAYANLAQTLLAYASGEWLDFLGEQRGVRRLARQDVSVTEADQTFKFYVRRGTFGDINQGHDIVVPAGTRVLPETATSPVFALDDNLTLPAGASEAYFAASALDTGAAGQTGANTLTRHNFSGYADVRYGSLLVTNQYGTIGGRDTEDDDSYRYRIQLALSSQTGCSEPDLRSALLQIPGIQDVVFERLSGTYNVYVYGISPDLPQSLIDMVQAQIDRSTAFPLTGTALAPDRVGITLATTVQLSGSLSAADAAAALTTAGQAAADYINNLAVGETLVLNEIADRIRNADPRIFDVGRPNQPINDIFLWRSRADGTRYSRYLIGNYVPAVGERILVEPQANAIALATE